ncbi:MAG: 2-C-methyl-D-erythritol 4-phosphate cytidylyltransferase, partial [Pseudomonadota bacterium]
MTSPASASVTAIIVAAGRGTRAGGTLPKQWRPLAGRRVLDWTLSVFDRVPEVTSLVVVLHPDDMLLADTLEAQKPLECVA